MDNFKSNDRLKNNNLRERVNIFLFSSGKLISLFGSAVYAFAIGLYLLKLTGSGLSFAANIVLYTLPVLFINPIAGVIADRINKKILVAGSDLMNGLFFFVIYIIADRNGLSVPLVYLSTFFMTVLTVFFNIAIESAKPNLVSRDKLVNINSLARVVESSSYIIGPMAGGLIYAFVDMKIFILFNAFSFVLAAVLEYFIDFQYNTAEVRDEEELRDEERGGFWREMKEGYKYIFTRRHIKALVYVFIALNFFFNYTIIIPLPYLLNNIWKVKPYIYGIVDGGLPVGMIIGALLVGKIMDRVSYSRLLKRIGYSTALGVIAYTIPLIIISSGRPTQRFILYYYTSLMVISGMLISWVDIPLNIVLQQIVPAGLLGRVISVKLSLIKAIVPIALLLSGYLVNLLGPLFLFITGSLIFLFFNIWFYRSFTGKRFVEVSNQNMADKVKNQT